MNPSAAAQSQPKKIGWLRILLLAAARLSATGYARSTQAKRSLSTEILASQSDGGLISSVTTLEKLTFCFRSGGAQFIHETALNCADCLLVGRPIFSVVCICDMTDRICKQHTPGPRFIQSHALPHANVD
jgi:hypothetical protein